MQLTDEDIREFSELWQQEFHETLSPGEARQYASSLLELYSLIAQPCPADPAPPDSNPNTPSL